jgi:hypothetical protein
VSPALFPFFQTALAYDHHSVDTHDTHMVYPILSPGRNSKELPMISLGRALVRPLGDREKMTAPVFTIVSNAKLSIYLVIEQHFRPDLISSPERFWKLVKTSFDPPLGKWRPRVNGGQLKALANVSSALNSLDQ